MWGTGLAASVATVAVCLSILTNSTVALTTHCITVPHVSSAPGV